ncbi:hypothetical protein GGF46_004811 [Coemansia sp. RSA 552]|nr:hypothetical protein GGF46_004811 [Coemansia sp. RSA 552]
MAASDDSDSESYQGCLSCRLVGAAAMTGLGLYTLRERARLDPHAFVLRRYGMLSLASAFFCAGVYRLTQK